MEPFGGIFAYNCRKKDSALAESFSCHQDNKGDGRNFSRSNKGV